MFCSYSRGSRVVLTGWYGLVMVVFGALSYLMLLRVLDSSAFLKKTNYLIIDHALQLVNNRHTLFVS